MRTGFRWYENAQSCAGTSWWGCFTRSAGVSPVLVIRAGLDEQPEPARIFARPQGESPRQLIQRHDNEVKQFVHKALQRCANLRWDTAAETSSYEAEHA